MPQGLALWRFTVSEGGRKMVVEGIETGNSDYVGNVVRALKAGFDEVVSVGVDTGV